ncbi:MAG: alpha/beta hydrolase-fold protein [Eubacteriales bacterium]|nr:alpha/beta hydrolase-fold protein [Eubacteriales bacterium]
MIGGHSMGGYAALHLAFRHPQLFCRVGGHSASLFPDAFSDTSISDWLDPDEKTRDRRDPIHLAETSKLTGLKVYLDTGVPDINMEGNALLAKILQEKGISCENHVFPGSHSRFYCTTQTQAVLRPKKASKRPILSHIFHYF